MWFSANVYTTDYECALDSTNCSWGLTTTLTTKYKLKTDFWYLFWFVDCRSQTCILWMKILQQIVEWVSVWKQLFRENIRIKHKNQREECLWMESINVFNKNSNTLLYRILLYRILLYKNTNGKECLRNEHKIWKYWLKWALKAWRKGVCGMCCVRIAHWLPFFHRNWVYAQIIWESHGLKWMSF